MASLYRNGDGVWQIQLTIDRRRRTLSLGSIAERKAHGIKCHVETIAECRWAGVSLPPDEQRWLDGIDDELHGKLADVDLVPPRTRAQLGPFIEAYIAGRTDVGGYTTRNLRDAGNRLTDYFGRGRDIRTITKADAKAWAIWLTEQEYAGPTRGRTIKRARQFFKHAIEARCLQENPFAGVKAPSQSNRTRAFVIDEPTATKILAACPDAVWRLRFALARYGGLRTPLEARRLTWADVRWGENRFAVRGKGGNGAITRYTPLFPEIRRELDAVWDLDLKQASGLVLPPLSHTRLRRGLEKIIAQSAVVQWPRLWQNLRLTRHAELSAIYPRHVVCEWLGNTEDVAELHYKAVTDDQFKLAAEGKPFTPPGPAPQQEQQEERAEGQPEG